MYQTEDNPNSEPGGWGLEEVSNKVGACGVHAWDTGEEWAIMACKSGIYGFIGGQPRQLTESVFNLWNCINWNAGNTMVLRNDVTNRVFYAAIPLPTGTSPEGVPTSTVQWLPNAPYNPAPTTPNVMLVCNYQGLGSFEAMVSDGAPLRVTMFGSLVSNDMRMKYTIWNIPTPYMSLVYQPNGIDQLLAICNGIASSKVYELNPLQYSDDSVAINSSYCTYGFTNSTKAASLPLFGLHSKRYIMWQAAVEGAGNMQVVFRQNSLDARYPYTVPGGVNLVSPVLGDDVYKPLNLRGNRVFVEFSSNAVGSWWEMSKMILTGSKDNWSPTSPNAGGNTGIA
jgi:hypothetical protein